MRKEELISRMKWVTVSLKQTAQNRLRMRGRAENPKVFCVGLNKTGTTSWAQAMRDCGFVVGSETRATMFYDHWKRGRFDRIVEYVRKEGEAFQDYPFSLPGTYAAMDKAFPGSRFILTVRNSADTWYESLIRFHAKNWSPSGSVPPRPEEIQDAIYWRRGFLADYCRDVFRTPGDAPYHQETLIRFYEEYIREVTGYFAGKPAQLLVLNVAERGSYRRLRDFLSLPPTDGEFPWCNRT